MNVRRARGGNVLATGRGGVAVVDDHRQVVVLVEDRIADATGEPVVPEPPVTHDGHRPFAVLASEGRRGCGTQAVTHDAVAHVERRQRRERMTADVGADVQRPDFLLQQLQR